MVFHRPGAYPAEGGDPPGVVILFNQHQDFPFPPGKQIVEALVFLDG
jgi:hypothetical protein